MSFIITTTHILKKSFFLASSIAFLLLVFGLQTPYASAATLTVVLTPFDPSTITAGQMSSISFGISSYGEDWQTTTCSAAGTAATSC